MTDEAVRQVVVATDRSVGGDHAARWARRLATDHGASLTIVQVLDPSTEPAALRRAEDELSGVAAAIDARSLIVTGDDIAAAIVDASRTARADVLVIGASGMRNRREFLLGNVANRVTHSSTCTTVIVPLGDDADATLHELAARDPRRLSRAIEILRILARSGLRELLTGNRSDEELALLGPRLRAGLEELGPTFCKLGQILSTRPDLLPPILIDELAALRSHVAPMPEAEVVKVMEQELCVPWDDVFASIEPEPLAAGTIGQVHRATLADGCRVVVKVQRAAAADLIERDMALLRSVARGAGIGRRLSQVIDLPAVIEDLSDSLSAECDFTKEAANLDRMGELMQRFPRIAVPRCHHELSTRRLLVMDEVQGIPIDEAPEGPERNQAARELLAACFHQVLSVGFFHADPHPGNLMWADGRIWLLDLGMVGEVSDADRRRLTLLLLAVWQGDASFLSDLVLGFAPVERVGSVDVEAFERSLAELVESVHGRSLAEIEIGPLLQYVTEVSVQHRVPIPTALTMVGKAFAQVQLTVSELSPDLDLFDEARRFFVRDLGDRLTGHGDPARWLYEMEKLRHRFTTVTESLVAIGGGRPGHRLEVGFTSERLEHTVTRAGRTLAVGFAGGCALLGAAMAAAAPGGPRRSARWLGALGGALGVTAAAMSRR